MRIRYLRDTLNGNEQDLRHKWDSIELLDSSNNSVANNATVTSSHDMIGELNGVLIGTSVYSSNVSSPPSIVKYTPGEYTCDPWLVDTYSNVKCVKNNSIGHSQSTSFTLNHNCPEGTGEFTKISLQCATSTQSGYDFLYIEVNDTREISQSGITDWTSHTLNNIKDGDNTIKFIYSKNASITSGNDSVYISEISVMKPASVDGCDYREEYLLVDLGEIMDVATIKVKHNIEGEDIKYRNRIEVSLNGRDWFSLFDSIDNTSELTVEPAEGRVFEVEDALKFIISEDYMNGYPISVNFNSSPDTTIDKSLCNLPYKPIDDFITYDRKWNFNISKFNGYLSSIKSQKAVGDKVVASNLPLRFSSPLSKSFWQIKSDILDGYPSNLRLDPTINYNQPIVSVSDEHYITPLRAKILIHKYMKQYMANRGKTQVPIVKNISIEEKNSKLILNWESPVDDPHWHRTLVYVSNVGYVTVDRETNELVMPSDCTYDTFLLETPDKEISKPYEVTNLTNGKKYYFSFITVSDTGVRNAYEDSCISGTPNIVYRPGYGSFGEYIGPVKVDD